ncbi:hypothetical protein Ahy_B01g055536 isoform H [Arachis hypogaea]|uniref:Uncharacterized protein n=1 Tax=Arachis hypogaea TaxID=3818 RepID=A0A445AWG4_ARAHY|nr:hypothetical protein Ahy_B01g055536 isoform H [Arachis hypogaea]
MASSGLQGLLVKVPKLMTPLALPFTNPQFFLSCSSHGIGVVVAATAAVVVFLLGLESACVGLRASLVPRAILQIPDAIPAILKYDVVRSERRATSLQ